MPAWPSRSSGFTCETTSGTVGSIRQADELSITVAPWATAAGASSSETSPPAENSAMSTPSKAPGTASPISRVRPSIETVWPGRSAGGEQAQLTDREFPLVEDLDHRPSDDAGGANDGDGEGMYGS